jgi:hypothetical protein
MGFLRRLERNFPDILCVIGGSFTTGAITLAFAPVVADLFTTLEGRWWIISTAFHVPIGIFASLSLACQLSEDRPRSLFTRCVVALLNLAIVGLSLVVSAMYLTRRWG